ncbi:MAG: peptide ABC transporter substrate-binding protein [Akkermansia sp.]|nr:peptide ABC transporter substrate-binding protein [Akkermansia sp.]
MSTRKAIIAILLGSLLAACGERKSSAERFAEDGILVIGNNSEPQSQDPHKATSVADGKIICTLLEGLVRPSATVDGEVLPGVAESWEHNEKADVWTFHLNPAACWSDGTPLTAQDFVYAYQRLLHPQFAGKYAEMLYPLAHAEAYNKGECDWQQVGVKALDKHTLQLTLSGPTPHLPRLMLHFTWFPVPAHKVEAMGGMLDRRSLWTRPEHWTGNGAYIIDTHRFNDYLSVKPNPLYLRKDEVKNKGIRFLPIVNGYTETRMYQGGKLHITNNVPPEMLAFARNTNSRDFCQDPYYCAIFYRLNTTRGPLRDLRVRRALHLAIDRDSLVNKVVRGAGKPADVFTPPGAGYAAQPPSSPATQAEREALARQLLAEAGYPQGKGFPILELMTTSRDVQRVMAETIQAMWEKVLGIHIDIRSCEWTAYKAAQQNMEYDISSSSWSGDYLDPATFVELWRSGGGNNCTGWGSPECDAALAAARGTGNAEERRAHLQHAEELMLQAQPIIPLYHSERTYLRSTRHVSGWQSRLLDNFPLDAVEVKP